MKRYLVIGILVVVMIAVAACATPAPTPQPTPLPPPSVAVPTAPPAAAVKLTNGKVVLGVINDQSGPYSGATGKRNVEAVKMAVEDFKAKYGDNALGGPISVIDADHQNKPDLGSSEAQQFYDQQGADAIFDVPSTAVGLAISQVANDKKKLLILVSTAGMDFTNAKCNKYTFMYNYNAYMLGGGTGTAVTKQGSKKWYLIYPNYAFGEDMKNAFAAAIQASGGTVLGSDASPFPNATGDFSNLLLKAQAAKPDVLGVLNASSDLTNVVKQFNEFKMFDQGIQLALGLVTEPDIASLGPDAFHNGYLTASWIWTEDEASKTWAANFLKRLPANSAPPGYVTAGTYSAAWQYLDAIRRAGTDDADAVVKALEGYKFNDFFIHNGYIRPEDHWVMHDAVLAQVRSEKEVTVPGDYFKLVSIISANDAAFPLEKSTCKMPK